MAVQTALWKQVTVLDKFETKKGSRAVKVGWMSRESCGDHIFYGDEIANAVSVGDVVDITANMTEDGFARNVQVQGGSLQSTHTAPLGNNEGAASSSRPRRSRAAA